MMQKSSLIGLCALVLLLPLFSAAQVMDTITMNNPSFEDFPRPGVTPSGWKNAGASDESPPDIQPTLAYNVATPAQHGNTYLGMVVRVNGTVEAVSQKLTQSLAGGTKYAFKFNVAKAQIYESPNRRTYEPENFGENACRLSIYGGNSKGEEVQLLHRSESIDNPFWQEFTVYFTPDMDFSYVTFKADYMTDGSYYNGNILLDNLSPFMPQPKNPEPIASKEDTTAIVNVEDPDKEDTLLAVIDTMPAEEPEPEVVKIPTKEDELVDKGWVAEVQPVMMINDEFKRDELVKGTKLRVKGLLFAADSSAISWGSYGALDELAEWMEANKDVVIRVEGHTNGIPDHAFCDMLSTQRARAVRDYLTSKGVNKKRVHYKGYGKRKPIATNRTPEGREKNQRVEVRILAIRGT